MTREDARNEAIRLFKSGCNCSQAVLVCFAEKIGMNPETAKKLALPFGGGMGRMREVCGAFSGSLMVLGMVSEGKDKATSYAEVQALAGEFRKANGSIICRELLEGVKADSAPTPEARTPEYYKKRPCAEIVGDAAEMVWDKLNAMGIAL